MTNRLLRRRKRIAIYGWHRLNGRPIQPLSTVHSTRYADYSLGIRLVSAMVFIADEPWSIYTVLEDPELAWILSHEGVIRNLRDLMGLVPTGRMN